MENPKEIITIHNVRKTYVVGTQQVHALAGIDLAIYHNDYVAIMGPSGSGKSTLMNILGCLDTPTSGRYVLNGTDVSHMGENELADLPHLRFFRSKSVIALAVSIMAALTVSTTPKNGGMCSPCLRARWT